MTRYYLLKSLPQVASDDGSGGLSAFETFKAIWRSVRRTRMAIASARMPSGSYGTSSTPKGENDAVHLKSLYRLQGAIHLRVVRNQPKGGDPVSDQKMI